MTQTPFRGDRECLQAWFEALGPMNGASAKDHCSGILPIEARLPMLRPLSARTAATRAAGVRVPLFDAFDSAGFDLLDRLIVLALLRDSFDARSPGCVYRTQLCDAAGASTHVQQEAVRARLEEGGVLRRLRLVQSDADSNASKRYYRMPAAAREALLRGETTFQVPAPVPPVSYPAFTTWVLAAASDLLVAVVPAYDGSLGWADPLPEGPGWDFLTPRRERLAHVARLVLSRPDGPLAEALREAEVVDVPSVAGFLLLASRAMVSSGLSVTLLETALKGIGGDPREGGIAEDCFGPASTLVLADLVTPRGTDRPTATSELFVARDVFGRLFPTPVQLAEASKTEEQKEDGEPIEKVAPRIRLDEVVLAPAARARLDEALVVPSAGARVASDWGLGEGLSAPAGVALLFYGPPGTGKTLAAEAVAGELGKSLFRVRLDRLLSKYVGETEKAIAGAFRAADASGDVVLLDEADALLGDRSTAERRWEISQTNVLLQEIERFKGVVILTTNRDRSLDPALERRLLARIEFAMPGEAERVVLWRKHLPPRAPVSPDVDLAALARAYPLSGSFIRTAAFMASIRASRRPEAERFLTQADLAGAAAEQTTRSKGERKPLGFVPSPAGHRLSHPAPEVVLERREK